MVSACLNTVWLYVALITVIWTDGPPRKAELSLVFAFLFAIPEAMLQAASGMYGRSNRECFLLDTRFRTWMVFGILPQAYVVLFLSASLLLSVVLVLCQGCQRFFERRWQQRR